MGYQIDKVKLPLLLLIVLSLIFNTLSMQQVSANTPKILYVSPSGTDADGFGLSADTPYKTIQYAADQTNPGDTVQVMNGTYGETSSMGVFYDSSLWDARCSDYISELSRAYSKASDTKCVEPYICGKCLSHNYRRF